MNWKDKFLNKIVCGDCEETMKDIPENSIDSCVTDLTNIHRGCYD